MDNVIFDNGINYGIPSFLEILGIFFKIFILILFSIREVHKVYFVRYSKLKVNVKLKNELHIRVN